MYLLTYIIILLLSQLQEPISELKLKWQTGKDLPFRIVEHPSMVVLKGKVYIGGYAYKLNDVEKRTVIVYDPQKDSCSTLPPYVYYYFSLAVVNNQLVLVGGTDSKDIDTNKLGVWDESSSRWTHPFPPMTTACSRPTIVTHKDRWLIVIGGDGGARDLSRVEILDTFSKQWHHSTPMPESLGCSHTLTATIGSTCYLIGGYVPFSQKRVLSVFLDELVSQACNWGSKRVSASSPSTPSLWQTLPDTPLKFSAPLALNGTLLAVGGETQQYYEARNTIYAYHPERREWVKAGEMPTERAKCSCIVLPSGEIMVVGTSDRSPIAQQIHLATVV